MILFNLTLRVVLIPGTIAFLRKVQNPTYFWVPIVWDLVDGGFRRIDRTYVKRLNCKHHHTFTTMASPVRSKIRSEFCNCTKEELLAQKKNPLDVSDDCPVCAKDGILCEVGKHPTTACKRRAIFIIRCFDKSIRPQVTSVLIHRFHLKVRQGIIIIWQ